MMLHQPLQQGNQLLPFALRQGFEEFILCRSRSRLELGEHPPAVFRDLDDVATAVLAIQRPLDHFVCFESFEYCDEIAEIDSEATAETRLAERSVLSEARENGEIGAAGGVSE